MFDSLKAAGAMASLMKNKEALRQSGERVKARLTELRAAGGSGGGAVRATMSGDMRLIAVTLEPAVCMGLASGNDAAREHVQHLIVQAVNNASDIAKAMAHREIAKEAEALGLPGVGGLGGMGGMMGGMEGLLGG